MKPQQFIDYLSKRGLVHDQTAGAQNYLDSTADKAPSVYAGFDPSAASLQVGNLLIIMLLRRAQLYGFSPIALLGGATGLVGDPSGKKQERTLLDKEVAASNLDKIKNQIAHFLDFDSGKYQAKFVNNHDWFANFNYLDFLRDVGKHISINYMLAKDSVKLRMETGISYAEFGYMLIQGYDFLHLYEKLGCRLQIGGSDQWGNMTTGIELIRRKHSIDAHAISAPLLTDANGNKLGKSEGGTALYLDAELTSPYQFYQYWLNQPDSEMEKLLLALTLIEGEQLDWAKEQIQNVPEKREAQKLLATEMTKLVHGQTACTSAQKAGEVMFSKNPAVLENVDEQTLQFLAREVPSTSFSQNCSILDLLVSTGLAKSKGEARRHIKGNAVHVNREKVKNEDLEINADSFGNRAFLLLGVGKQKLLLVRRK